MDSSKIDINFTSGKLKVVLFILVIFTSLFLITNGL